MYSSRWSSVSESCIHAVVHYHCPRRDKRIQSNTHTTTAQEETRGFNQIHALPLPKKRQEDSNKYTHYHCPRDKRIQSNTRSTTAQEETRGFSQIHALPLPKRQEDSIKYTHYHCPRDKRIQSNTRSTTAQEETRKCSIVDNMLR
jgi:hypothetical protein